MVFGNFCDAPQTAQQGGYYRVIARAAYATSKTGPSPGLSGKHRRIRDLTSYFDVLFDAPGAIFSRI
jgi:hypothetical protein